MPWFKVDDGLHDHHKARRAGKAAMGVWVLAGSWSAANLTDGFIPTDVLARWGSPADAQRLVEADLWVVDTHRGERGWRFKDWAVYQPVAADLQQIRANKTQGALHSNHIRWHVKKGIKNKDCRFCGGDQ